MKTSLVVKLYTLSIFAAAFTGLIIYKVTARRLCDGKLNILLASLF